MKSADNSNRLKTEGRLFFVHDKTKLKKVDVIVSQYCSNQLDRDNECDDCLSGSGFNLFT